MKRAYLLPILVVMLLAAWLRLSQLTAVPPGLTHDEANHGREALEVLGGTLLYYFPYNYGSEPLYSYTVAGMMGLAGRNIVSLRLVNVFMGLLAIALTYRWAALVFDEDRRLRPVALTAAAFMAVSFWPIASSREALRAGMLPALTAGAALLLWQIVPLSGRSGSRSHTLIVVGLVLTIVAAFHNYLATRVWWLLFPAFAVYLFFVRRPALERAWKSLTITLIGAGILVIPMFWYLRLHPEMQPRLRMLSSTLDQLTSGNLQPFVANALNALGAFVLPGFGDSFLAYNIPGRPLFDPITGIFFVVGVGIAIWRWRQPGYGYLLLWFGLGIVPSLVTGPTANTTRNVAALPAIYILLAVGLIGSLDWLRWRLSEPAGRRIALALGSLLLLFVAARDSYDYFVRWAQDPDVRAAYQVNLIANLDYLSAAEPTIVSSVYPGPAHDISIAMSMLGTTTLDWRGVEANSALVLPENGAARLLVPTATPLHPYFMPWVSLQDEILIREDDSDPSFAIYQLSPPELTGQMEAVGATLGRAVSLLGLSMAGCFSQAWRCCRAGDLLAGAGSGSGRA